MKYIDRLFSFNSSRQRLWKEMVSFAKQVPNGAFVLDAGSGSGPYRSLFTHTNYESADFEQIDKAYAPTTYLCDLQNIPVEESRFDFILFNQVLEHLSEPKLVLAELNRVLKPDGKMIFSVPLFYEEHEQPYDYYRYTQYGLCHLFSTTGFTIEQLDWLEGYFGSVGYQLNCMSRYLPHKPQDFGGGVLGYCLVPIVIFLKIVFACSSILFHRMETRAKFKRQGFPKNYIGTVRKRQRTNANSLT